MSSIPNHRDAAIRGIRSKTRSSRACGRAFTLLEVMLAAVLGALILGASLALFTTMDRAKRLQNARLEANLERQLAHRTIQQALRTLVMDATPEPKDDDLKNTIEDDIRDAQEGGQDRRMDTAIMRFALQPDISKRTALGLPMQTLDLTISTPPIHAMSRSTEAQRMENDDLRQLALSRRREMWSDRALSVGMSSKGSASRGTSSDSKSGAGSSSRERTPESTAARQERLRAGASELSGTEPSAESVGALAGQSIDAPRAPGVRGVFEFRPEDDAKVLARAEGSGAGAVWALWWKQIPVEDDGLDDASDPADASGADTGVKSGGKTGGADAVKLKQDAQRQRERLRRIQLTELARASRSDAPEIKLLSGLTGAQWQVYRRRKMVTKMAAMYAKELPAYVNPRFESIDGRHDDWLFEVAWSYGQEPGTVLAVNDPLGAPFDPTADALAAALQAAATAAGGRPGLGGNPKPGTDPIASTGGPPGHATPVGGTVTGGNGRPIVITLPGGGTITIPAGSVPGGGR